MVQFASYVRRVLHKTRLIFSRINGPIVAETFLRMQIFPSLAARETCVAETNFAARKQKMFLPWSQKHFCFPDTNFASETYVSQFSHPRKHNKKHCFRNNVS